MSGILKYYFEEKKYKSPNSYPSKYLTTYNDTKRLFNSGLHLLDNNILTIDKTIRNSKMNITKQYNFTEPNTYDLNNFHPYINSKKMDFSKSVFSKHNDNLKPIYNLIPNLKLNKTLSKGNNDNKDEIASFPYFKQRKKINRNIIRNYNKIEKKYKNKIKCLTSENNTSDNSKEVEKIIDSLISINNNKIIKKGLHHAEFISLKKNKEKFPLEKSISPAFYIDFNLHKEPENKQLFRSFNTQLKCLNNRIEFREKILKQVETNDRNRLKVDNLKNIHNSEFYTDLCNKRIGNIFLIDKNYNKTNLHFNLYDYYNSIHKMKVKNRFKFNNKKFEKLKNNIKENKNLITFDKKLKNAQNSTIKAVKYLDSLSKKNNKMLKKIFNIYNIYNIHNK